MKNKLTLLGFVAAIGMVGASGFILTKNEQPTEFNFSYVKAKSLVNFSAANITRRVYFYIEGEWGEWKDSTYVLHYTLDGTSWSWSGDATEFYGDYYKGLYYVDITGVGVGSSFTAQVKASGGDAPQKYTVNVDLPSLADKTFDVIHVEAGNVGDNRAASISAAGAAEIGKIASFLNFMRPCDGSYAYGYNAYPQFKANFLDPDNAAAAISESGDSTNVSDRDKEDTFYYTVNQKIAELENQYEKNGWYVA